MNNNTAGMKGLFVNKYCTDTMNAIFNDKYYIQKLLDVEAALAQSQAEIGIIPTDAAKIIISKANVELIDMEQLYAASQHTHHPLIPILKVFTALCGDAGKYVHWGVTTQDILDTATVLQVRDAFQALFAKLITLNQALCNNAQYHKKTLMMGRTNGQQALPITLGFKFAVWAAESQRHIERLLSCKERLFVGQFSGAVGTLASLEEHGFVLREKIFTILDLKETAITWNTSRDNFVELASVIGIMASTLGKIGQEIYALQKQEIAELEEYVAPHTTGSSTMPHKKNPFLSLEVVSAYRILKGVVGEAFESLETEHERDPRSLNIESDYLPKLFQLTDYTLESTIHLVNTLGVNESNMVKNLNLLNGVVLSEAVMMKLSEHVGKAEAHEIIFDAAMESLDQQQPFKDVLLNNSIVSQHLSKADLDKLIEPTNYLGLTEELIDSVIKENQALWQSAQLDQYLECDSNA